MKASPPRESARPRPTRLAAARQPAQHRPCLNMLTYAGVAGLAPTRVRSASPPTAGCWFWVRAAKNSPFERLHLRTGLPHA
ncbi:hypothetical protein E2562_013586 [Oryza meyeriana var. granulata]|uniref:Uncharacterized protein n=1 Tax=Oryza meyeriana var. granulata TaxID=110450 RepID=A0A6G1C5N5_9ORYZ|nr:hypothetical protein E2562_013586 [Oryza meyeriana var. granulata]